MPFLFELLIICIVLGLVYWLVTMLPLPRPFKTIAICIIIVITIIWLLGLIGFGGWGPRRWRSGNDAPPAAATEV